MDEPMDFAAWIEVYLGGTWCTFDPRNNERAQGPRADRPRAATRWTWRW